MELLSSLGLALTPINLLLALGGVVIGTIVGALPGLSAAMAIAVLVPFTFTMVPASALIALGAIYTGAIYGGAFSAILVNTPGTPSSIATTFDGFPMAKRGDGNLAVTLATLASVIGGIVGIVFLLLLAPPLAKVALAFGPPEYFWLAVLGLTLISALSTGNMMKGFIGGCIGLLLAMIGVAVVGGDIRFTMNSQTLLGGVSLIPALIGLYCVPVLIDLVATPDPHLKVVPGKEGYRLGEAFGLIWRSKVNTIRSSIIGTVVGILPGAGGSIACLVSYAEARRSSKTPERFGQGDPDGVIATETANNATVGGGFIPTLVLGIPGTPPDAIILGALLVQGIRVGPSLFTQQSPIVYTFVFGLLIATLLMLPAGLLLGRYAYRSIVATPKSVLVPLVAFLTVIGSFMIHNNPDDILLMVVLGIIGWGLGRLGFTASPIVLGLVLGQIAEQGFVQAYLIGSAQNNLLEMYFGRPISLTIVAVAAVTMLYPPLSAWLRARKSSSSAVPRPQGPAAKPRDTAGMIAAGLLILVGLAVLWDSRDLSTLGAVFPRTIATVMILCCVIVIGQNMRRQCKARSAAGPQQESVPRRVFLSAALVAWAVALPVVGLFTTSLAGFAALLVIAEYNPWSARRAVAYGGIGLLAITVFYFLMRDVLLISLPRGLLF